MPEALNPIKRVWKPSMHKNVPAQHHFDIYGHEIFAPHVHEKNTDSIWDTYEALQAAAAERAAKLKHK